MNKLTLLCILALIGLLITGVFVNYRVDQEKPSQSGVRVLRDLPFAIEPTNPVPEVRSWNQNGRTYYYFNWGLKPTGGYDLQFAGIRKNTILIKALSPASNAMRIQILTYPRLLLSLPSGKYRYQVIDENNKTLNNIFKPKNQPLKLTVYLPDVAETKSRVVLRDPYLNNEGETTAQIAVEALFHQPELQDYLEHEIVLEGVSFSRKERKWYILLSESFEALNFLEQKHLSNLITKTVLAVKAEGLDQVEVTTDKARLPELEN